MYDKVYELKYLKNSKLKVIIYDKLNNVKTKI